MAESNRRGRKPAITQEKTVVSNETMKSYLPLKGDSRTIEFLPIDEIINRKGWKTYRDMRNDDQVKATLAFKKILIHGRLLDVIGEGEQADFMEWQMKRLNTKRIFREALSAFDFGFSVGEKIYEITEWEGKRVIALKDIKFRDPEDITLHGDKHGNLTKIEQEPGWGQIVEIPPEKAWHYAHNQEFGNLYGRSELRAVYKNWWAKKFLVNFWNVYLEKQGVGQLMMKYPQGASEELKTTLRNMLSGLSTSSEMLVPQGVEVELLESARNAGTSYKDALMYHDNAIARGLLVVALLGAPSEGFGRGTDSQSRLHLRILFKSADEIAKDLIWSFKQQVMTPLLEMNFNDMEHPDLIWQDYGEFEGIEIADTIRLLHSAGILDLNQDDVNYARSVLGLPLREEGDDEDEVIRPPEPPPPGQASAPPPAANQGNTRAEKGAGGNRATDSDGNKK